MSNELDTALARSIDTPVHRLQPVLARPFVKWVGGKGAILNAIKEHIPEKIERYYELFIGGGALFFNIAHRINKATIVDVNLELMISYKVIQKNVNSLISRLLQHQERHSKEYYYRLRGLHDLHEPIERAARFIYLNKTCYNGLYRVNSKGRFNAPMGSYTNPKICDVDNLKAVSKVLQGVEIVPYSFDTIRIEAGSLVYCDPPYHENYNQYTADQFNDDKQHTLRTKAVDWIKKGCTVIISNSNTELIRALYSDNHFNINEIQAPRSVGCKSASRGNTTELLIIGT